MAGMAGRVGQRYVRFYIAAAHDYQELQSRFFRRWPKPASVVTSICVWNTSCTRLPEEPTSAKILRACAVDLAKLRKQLEEFLTTKVASLPDGVDHEPEQTVSISAFYSGRFSTCIRREKSQISSVTCWRRCSREQDSRDLLAGKPRVTRLDVVNYLSHGIEKTVRATTKANQTGCSFHDRSPRTTGIGRRDGGESDKSVRCWKNSPSTSSRKPKPVVSIH